MEKKTPKDFWNSSTVAVLGGGSWGTVVAHLLSRNSRSVRMWVRSEEDVRRFNSTRVNLKYVPGVQLDSKVYATSSLAQVFNGGVQAIFWVLPSQSCRVIAKEVAPLVRGDEILIHATKGIEAVSMKRISQILSEELPLRRLGVMSGPNLAHEIAQGEPAATVVASSFDEVCDAGQYLLQGSQFRVYREKDLLGVELAGVLKNILAIAAGVLDGLKMGANCRSMLITLGLKEMVRFGVFMGAQEETFLGLAGIGDVLATCGSSESRNYRVGFRLAQGDGIDQILAGLGSTAEGVLTAQSVFRFAQEHGISMPLTQSVCQLIQGEGSAQEIVQGLTR